MLPLNVACNNEKMRNPRTDAEYGTASEWSELETREGLTYTVTRAWHLSKCPAINICLECKGGAEFREVMTKMSKIEYVSVWLYGRTHTALYDITEISKLLRTVDGNHGVRIEGFGGTPIFEGTVASARVFLLLRYNLIP